MGKPLTLLEDICRHAVSIGHESIQVEYKDGELWVIVEKGGMGVSIAHFASSSADAEELRQDLSAIKKRNRTILDGKVYVLKVRVFDRFGEDAFEVSIDPAPKLDPTQVPAFTKKQGQYLAFIYNYTKIHGQAPAEADLERYFQVSPPSIHEMIKTLQRAGLIEKTPRQARSIRLLVPPEHLPRLE
jgi:hypothetical protein